MLIIEGLLTFDLMSSVLVWSGVWSYCYGVFPRRDYLGQKLGMCVGDPHPKHFPVERRPSNMSVETHGAGGKPADCPQPPDLPCSFVPD